MSEIIKVEIEERLRMDEKELCTQACKKCGYHQFNRHAYHKIYELRRKIRKLRKFVEI